MATAKFVGQSKSSADNPQNLFVALELSRARAGVAHPWQLLQRSPGVLTAEGVILDVVCPRSPLGGLDKVPGRHPKVTVSMLLEGGCGYEHNDYEHNVRSRTLTA
jgi:hypothetical protein